MSLAVGAEASSSKMGLEDDKEEGIGDTNNETDNEGGEEREGRQGRGMGERRMSETSLYATEEEEDDEGHPKIQLGPQYTLKEQLEKDKDDESLRKWKEQLLGSVDVNDIGESLDPEVKILSLAILSAGRPDIVLDIPESGNPKGSWFTLKEGSHYSMKFSFKVSNNIVSGLRYSNTVWKTGVKVDSTKEMIGTFSPQQEPYTHVIPEEITPSGMFARGSYSAKTKFLDDDNKCYLEMNYTFDIRRDWASDT